MELFIVRHAWAEPLGDPAWPSDAQRPLTAEGRKRFARMAEILVSRGVAPDLIATSPLVRCVQTAEILARAVGPQSQVVLANIFGPAAIRRDSSTGPRGSRTSTSRLPGSATPRTLTTWRPR